MTTSSIGVESSTSEGIVWSSIDQKRIQNPTISSLMEEVNNLYINVNSDNRIIINNDILKILIDQFNLFLGNNKFLFSFTNSSLHDEKLLDENKNDKKKNDKKKNDKIKEITDKDGKIDIQRLSDINKKNKKTFMSISDATKNNNNIAKFKKIREEFIESLIVDIHFMIKDNKNEFECFFSIVYWVIYLERIMEKNNNISMNILIDASISFYRAIEDSRYFLSDIMIDESYTLLNRFERKVIEKVNDQLYNLLLINPGIILESHWDHIKLKSIALYEEQKDIISLIKNNLKEKLLVFYESPPANGKTMIAVMIAKVIAHQNNIEKEKDNSYKKKTLLYICYNSIVRDEVATLCTTQNVDVKFWMSNTHPDGGDNGKIKTFLHPHKSCYPEWNNTKNKSRPKNEKEKFKKARQDRYSENLIVQMRFYLEETQFVSKQDWNKYLEDIQNPDLYNLVDKLVNPINKNDKSMDYPEMIISDLDSAYELLEKFPNMFVTYFDEAFAAAHLSITPKIFKALNGGPSILVSATLAKPEEIPSVINHFKNKNRYEDNSFIRNIRSLRQNISCTFIDSSGKMLALHQKMENIEELRNFLNNSFEEPLVKRSYSPDIVFSMIEKINDLLSDDLKFRTRFDYLGKLSHGNIRQYAYDILKYIVDNNRVDIFDILKNIEKKKITNMDVNTILTSSAVNYQHGKFLHVATSNGFGNHLKNICDPFLSGSPKVSTLVQNFKNEQQGIKKQIASNEKAGCSDSKELLYKQNELQSQLENIKLEWPKEFLWNSNDHATKFDTKEQLTNANNRIYAKIDDLNGMFDETCEKLLFSGIGVYQPENFNNKMTEWFLSNKDKLRGILSTPSIVYGTNISGLSKIDIDKSFVNDSTKNILYQLVGRAGRKGKSDSAVVIFRDDKMIDIILNNNNSNVEAMYIEDYFKKN